MKDGVEKFEASYMVTIKIKQVDKVSVTADITDGKKLNRSIRFPLTTFHHGFIHEEDIPHIEIGSSFYAFFQRKPPMLWNICPKTS